MPGRVGGGGLALCREILVCVWVRGRQPRGIHHHCHQLDKLDIIYPIGGLKDAGSVKDQDKVPLVNLMG